MSYKYFLPFAAWLASSRAWKTHMITGGILFKRYLVSWGYAHNTQERIEGLPFTLSVAGVQFRRFSRKIDTFKVA